MKGVIDRFEGEWVVVEIDGVTYDMKRSRFPQSAKEGDVVWIDEEGARILVDETNELKNEIAQLMNELWED